MTLSVEVGRCNDQPRLSTKVFAVVKKKGEKKRGCDNVDVAETKKRNAVNK